MKNKFNVSISSPVFLFQQNAATQKLKKAWQDLENRQARILRNMRVERNRLKGAFSTNPSVRSLFLDTDPEEGSCSGTQSGPSVPGFRFKANGEPKKTIDVLRRERLQNSLAVLKKRGSESTGRTLASSSEISDDVNTSAVDETDSISVADAEGASGRAGSSPPWSSTGVFPAGLARRHSVGNTVGYKVDEKTRHTSCFNICPKTQSVEDTNFLELTPNTVVRQVQKQLGLHTRMSEPVMFGAVDCTKEVEQLERAINVLQMTMSNPDVDASLLEPLGQHKRRTIIKVQRETGEDGAAPKRRHCEACGHPKGRYNDPGVVRPAPTYNKPRWQIPPVGRLVPEPITNVRLMHTGSGLPKKDVPKSQLVSTSELRRSPSADSIQTTGSRSDPSLASHRGVVGSAVSLRDRSKPPAAPPGKGPFDAVVYMMAEANRPESELMLPDLQQPRHRLLNRNLQLLRSRNSSENEALQPRVQQFLKTFDRRKVKSAKQIKSAK